MIIADAVFQIVEIRVIIRNQKFSCYFSLLVNLCVTEKGREGENDRKRQYGPYGITRQVQSSCYKKVFRSTDVSLYTVKNTSKKLFSLGNIHSCVYAQQNVINCFELIS